MSNINRETLEQLANELVYSKTFQLAIAAGDEQEMVNQITTYLTLVRTRTALDHYEAEEDRSHRLNGASPFKKKGPTK